MNPWWRHGRMYIARRIGSGRKPGPDCSEMTNSAIHSLNPIEGRSPSATHLAPHWAEGRRRNMPISLARHFGMSTRPVCMICKGQTMNVSRRSPHPLFGNAYELQTFECAICGGEIKRSSDVTGRPHASEAAPSAGVVTLLSNVSPLIPPL
jgi:hypothetical protein